MIVKDVIVLDLCNNYGRAYLFYTCTQLKVPLELPKRNETIEGLHVMLLYYNVL